MVLLGGAWNSAVGQVYDLTKLKSVCVQGAGPSDVLQVLGVSMEATKNHVYVLLKGKLPRLWAEPYIGRDEGPCAVTAPMLSFVLDVGIGKTVSGMKTGYYGMVLLALIRPTVWESGQAGRGIAYYNSILLTGPISEGKQRVIIVLEELLTDFAAEYYKAGNP